MMLLGGFILAIWTQPCHLLVNTMSSIFAKSCSRGLRGNPILPFWVTGNTANTPPKLAWHPKTQQLWVVSNRCFSFSKGAFLGSMLSRFWGVIYLCFYPFHTALCHYAISKIEPPIFLLIRPPMFFLWGETHEQIWVMTIEVLFPGSFFDTSSFASLSLPCDHSCRLYVPYNSSFSDKDCFVGGIILDQHLKRDKSMIYCIRYPSCFSFNQQVGGNRFVYFFCL